MTPDLNLASNIFGPLNGELRARLMAAINDPCEATWDDARTIILSPDVGMGLTLWQAVLTLKHGCVPLDADPHDVPTREEIAQAIQYATH